MANSQNGRGYHNITASTAAQVHAGDSNNTTNNYFYPGVPSSYTPAFGAQGSVIVSETECIRSLSFPNIDARKNDIALAHRNTCNWFLETTQYKTWVERQYLESHNGVLWIKGKPGAGKSTLLRHTLRQCQKESSDMVFAAYFFNARGDRLEKSPLGMYRSLVLQLIEELPDCMERFLPYYANKVKRHGASLSWEWGLGELRDFLLFELTFAHSHRIMLFIDALDECNDNEAQDVVCFLEDLSTNALTTNRLNICLSSRHYPNIGMKKCLNVVLEANREHAQDIIIYVKAKLRTTNARIEGEILRKADGVFMWVTLVVKMLNQAFDRGQMRALENKLREIPSDLNEILSSILEKDNSNMQETILMFQWVLFARRRLSPAQLYHAVLSGTKPEYIRAWDQLGFKTNDIENWIIHVSRGLVEVRKSHYDETAQFVHETVKDFLLRHRQLQKFDRSLRPDAVSASHDRLKSCCLSYIEAVGDLSMDTAHDSAQLPRSYPLITYASTQIFYHANEAQRGGVSQQEYLQHLVCSDSFEELVRLHDSIKVRDYDFDDDTYKYTKIAGTELLYIFCLQGHEDLVRLILLEETTDVNEKGGSFGNALQAAVRGQYGDEDLVRLLLEAGADVNAKGGQFGNALQAAVQRSETDEAVVRLLLEAGADVNAQGGLHGSALQAVAQKDDGEDIDKEIVRLLLDEGADINAQGGQFGNALQAAIHRLDPDIPYMLIEEGANVHAQGGYWGNALQIAAASYDDPEFVQGLLWKNVDVNAQRGHFGNALQAAASFDHWDSMELLLKAGANVNAQGGYYGNALQAAAAPEDSDPGDSCDSVRMLLDAGADVNAQGGLFGNALQAAACRPKGEAVVRLLLEAGANVNAQGGKYGSALQAAACQTEGEAVVRLLLEAGANVNAKGGLYGSAIRAAKSRDGNEKVARLLLEAAAAGINTQDNDTVMN
jgi:ankyrin repeat protein